MVDQCTCNKQYWSTSVGVCYRNSELWINLIYPISSYAVISIAVRDNAWRFRYGVEDALHQPQRAAAVYPHLNPLIQAAVQAGRSRCLIAIALSIMLLTTKRWIVFYYHYFYPDRRQCCLPFGSWSNSHGHHIGCIGWDSYIFSLIWFILRFFCVKCSI